jgi:indole-3-glycerol phosphate synthase
MHSILEQIVADTRRRVAAAKQELPPDVLWEKIGTLPPRTPPASAAIFSTAAAASTFPSFGGGSSARETHRVSSENEPTGSRTARRGGVVLPAVDPFAPVTVPSPSFAEALAAPGLSFICEVKQASPSKGLIAEDFDHLQVACGYVAAGADAISVLTEPTFFKGSPRFLEDIAAACAPPTLRKDFVIDEYQIAEARLLGARAVLLIAALLDDDELAAFVSCADRLGLDVLAEAHTADEVRRVLAAGARIVGVNNRDLNSFEVDLLTSVRLRDLVPGDVLYVAESGIRNEEDVAQLAAAGVDAVLVGETLMRSGDKAALLARMREAANSSPHSEGRRETRVPNSPPSEGRREASGWLKGCKSVPAAGTHPAPCGGVRGPVGPFSLETLRVSRALEPPPKEGNVDAETADAVVCVEEHEVGNEQRMHEIRVKICGLSRDEDVAAVNVALPDYAGFVFAPSRRQVTPEEAARLRAQLDGRIVPVGVFVEEDIERIAELYARGLFEYAQLHGAYLPEQIDGLRRRCGASLGIIRAVTVDEGFDPALLPLEHPSAEHGIDYLLFDYRRPGSGRRFDWKLLKGVQRPYFLAGGVTRENLDEALALAPFAVDVSSGVETDGLKDPRKIIEFVRSVRRV